MIETRKSQLFQNKIAVKKSSIHGYGVFAEKDFEKNELIEECYGVLYSHSNCLDDYSYYAADNMSFLPAGYGIIYNHSDNPNVAYTFDLEKSILCYQATRKIFKGEELFVSYGKNWFSSRSMPYKKTSFRGYLRRIYTSKLFRGLIVCSFIYLPSILLRH